MRQIRLQEEEAGVDLRIQAVVAVVAGVEQALK